MQWAASIVVSFPVIYLLAKYFSTPATSPPPRAEPEEPQKEEEKPKSIMQPENPDVAPPKDDPFTLEQLKQYDGSDPSKPIYLAIKGMYVSR